VFAAELGGLLGVLRNITPSALTERIVQRPPTEIRKMEEERSRREWAHRRLRWQHRLRVGVWALGAVVLAVLLALFLRLAAGSVF
jgi:hypothetical protein